jgi:hypothetical protein
MIGVFVGFSRIFLLGILIFKGLTARRLYKSFGVKGLNYASALWYIFVFVKYQNIHIFESNISQHIELLQC